MLGNGWNRQTKPPDQLEHNLQNNPKDTQNRLKQEIQFKNTEMI